MASAICIFVNALLATGVGVGETRPWSSALPLGCKRGEVLPRAKWLSPGVDALSMGLAAVFVAAVACVGEL